MKSSATKKTTAKSAPVKKAVKKAVVKTKQDTQTLAQAKSCPKCSSCQDEMTDAFIQEVTEEVKNDNLKAFWNKYGLYIVLFVVISVSAAVGFETIKAWHQRQMQAKTESYIAAMVQDGNYENSIKALEKIAAGNYGIYSQLARIQIADILFEQNKLNDALKMLEVMANNDELSPRVRSLASLKLATYKIDTATPDEIKALLEPVANANNAWTPLAKDMLAMVAIKTGDFEDAKLIYNELLQNENVSENFRLHIQDMLSALSDM
ncbi:MAG: tetratricopeptide repeat protein [Alphaproteobacteria bacterium]|nr:tetratricopeptide repeat protein [Alphaproteobacteria bacterium]